jgi:hypothetical protein
LDHEEKKVFVFALGEKQAGLNCTSSEAITADEVAV